MKNILFISYYFPPLGNSGSYRVLRLANKIIDYEWEPIVLTVEDPDFGRFPRLDLNSLAKYKGKIYRAKHYTPNRIFKKGLLFRISRKIWAKICFPDDRIFWTIPAYFKAIKIIKRENISVVFISGSPYSSFIIGFFLKTFQNIKLIIDYRDPWTGKVYYMKSKWKHYLNTKIERRVLRRADKVYTVTESMTEFIKNSYLPDKYLDENKFDTLLYGFVPEDYQIKASKEKNNNKFKLIFAGRAFKVADPLPLIKAIAILKELEYDLYKKTEVTIIGDLLDGKLHFLKQYDISEKFVIKNFMPFEEVTTYLSEADLLLLPYQEFFHMKLCLPVKFYDYLALKKPILFYGPKGEIWKQIINSNLGFCRKPDDINGIYEAIKSIYELTTVSNFVRDEEGIVKFHIDNVIKKFANDLSQLE